MCFCGKKIMRLNMWIWFDFHDDSSRPLAFITGEFYLKRNPDKVNKYEFIYRISWNQLCMFNVFADFTSYLLHRKDILVMH